MPPINVTDNSGNSATGTTGATGFCIPARNPQGKDCNIGFRCWPEMAQAVNKIIAKQLFNYRTAADLHRHALSRHLEYLTEKNPKAKKWWFSKVVEVLEARAHLAELQTATTYLSKEAEFLQNMGEEGKARQVVCEMINWISEGGAPESMKRRYLKLIRKRHLRLLLQVPVPVTGLEHTRTGL